MVEELIKIREELLVGVESNDLLYIKMQINRIDTLIYEANHNKISTP